eukprot:765311-Hanusia_phi.AAC.2
MGGSTCRRIAGQNLERQPAAGPGPDVHAGPGARRSVATVTAVRDSAASDRLSVRAGNFGSTAAVRVRASAGDGHRRLAPSRSLRGPDWSRVPDGTTQAVTQ